MTQANHYVNNKEFHTALVERKLLRDNAKLDDKPEPQITNYLGSVFLKMANNIVHKHNFNRYPFKDEMISDGLIDCLKYIDTFDVVRTNPFAYFTSAISNAFIRRIIKEKKQGYIKSKLLSDFTIDIHELQNHDEDGEFTNAFREYMNAYNNFDGSIFDKKKKEFVEKPYSGAQLEEFFETDL